MRVFSIAKGFHKVTKDDPGELSEKEINRLRALKVWEETEDVGFVCQTFGVSRATLYRWRGQFDPTDVGTLRERSRRPRRVRQPTWSYELIESVRKAREKYPRWGKDKLPVLRSAEGQACSVSKAGRILSYLKKRGVLVEPKRRAISATRKSRRPYGIRKPREYAATAPGDLVQVDTLDVRPLPGVALKQFTARDVVSRWDVLEARSRATSQTAKEFIATLEQRMPFEIRAIQVDGGGEFYADFELECQKRNIRLFVLPPKSPKLNGAVERAQRTHTEEFYELHDCSWRIPKLNRDLLHWEYIYNCVRPHQALKYKTPQQFLTDLGIVATPYPSHLSHM
jgi:transposase InsO family protein